MPTRLRFIAPLLCLSVAGSTYGCSDELDAGPVEFRLVNASSHELSFFLRSNLGQNLHFTVTPVGGYRLNLYDPPMDCWLVCGNTPASCDYGAEDLAYMMAPGGEVSWEWSGGAMRTIMQDNCMELVDPEPGRYRVEIDVTLDPQCPEEWCDENGNCTVPTCEPCEVDETGICSTDGVIPYVGERIVASAEFDFPTTAPVEIRVED